MRPEQSRCFVAARRVGLYVTSAQRAESDAAPFMWCAVRRKGAGLGACLVVAVLTVADRLHAAHFIVAIGCCTVDETSRPTSTDVRGSEGSAPSTILLEPVRVFPPDVSIHQAELYFYRLYTCV